MVYHGFKGDDDTDAILKEIPKNAKSGFIKTAIKAYVEPDTRKTVEGDKPPKRIPQVHVLERKAA